MLPLKLGQILCNPHAEEEPSLEASSEEEQDSESEEEEVAPRKRRADAASTAKPRAQARSSARQKAPANVQSTETAGGNQNTGAKKPLISVKIDSVKRVIKRRTPEQAALQSPGPALGMEAGAEVAEEISEASQRRKAENIKAMLGQK